jgi:molybdopterin/thiamine biosynthesis adenylyltransferase
MITSDARLSRQSEIINDDMQNTHILIAGCGMLGSWTAHALTRAVETVTLFDGHDEVEVVNTGNQAYHEGDVGLPKGEAIQSHLIGLDVRTVAQKFPTREGLPAGVQVVVSCVDDLTARKKIARWCHDHAVPLFIDTRAQGEVAAVLTCETAHQYDTYIASVPTEAEVEDVPCGGTGTAYVGMFVAARVAGLINAYFRGLKLPKLEVWHVGMGQMLTKEDW